MRRGVEGKPPGKLTDDTELRFLLRLAFLFRRPLGEVLCWPSSHVALFAEYLSHEPAPEERIEYAVAQLCAMYASAHKGKGAKAPHVTDFMLFRNVWKQVKEETISEFASSFGGVKHADHHR